MRMLREQALGDQPLGVQFIMRSGASVSHSYVNLPQLRFGLGGGSDGNNHITITPALVPNDVATVTANYPASSYPGRVPDRMITERVRNNVVIFVITGGWDPPSLTYRSASGAILRSSKTR